VILFDTHIVLALLGQVDLVLPSPVAKEMHSNATKFVSVATMWELAIKYRLGKLRLELPLNALQNSLQRIQVRILDVTVAHTLAAIGPEPATKDPFDRLLLGVCAAERLQLLTIDRALAAHPLSWREKQGY